MVMFCTDEISALEILVPKLEMEAESIGPEQEELTKQLQAKKKLCSLSKDDEKKLKGEVAPERCYS